jgi:multiple sugar transport system ATP-binding protein
VAGFIGSPAMNLCTVPLNGDRAVSFGGVEVPLPEAARGGAEIVLGFRPESLELAAEGVPAQVEVVEEVGADTYVFCVSELAGGTTKLVARVETRHAPARDDRVRLRPRAEEAHLFDPDAGVRIDSASGAGPPPT